MLGFNKDYANWKPDVAPTSTSMQMDLFSTDVHVGSEPTYMSVQDGRSTDVRVDQERKYLKKDIKERIALFETFYFEYPRKVSRKKAEESWKRLCKQSDFDPETAIMNTINFAQTCKLLETETKFIPHPSTYLNQRRYEDYPIVDPEGLAKGKDKLSDNLDFLRKQLEGSHEQGRGQLTSGEGVGSLSEKRTEF